MINRIFQRKLAQVSCIQAEVSVFLLYRQIRHTQTEGQTHLRMESLLDNNPQHLGSSLHDSHLMNCVARPSAPQRPCRSAGYNSTCCTSQTMFFLHEQRQVDEGALWFTAQQ